ncbi:SERTA domain-containing protein 2 [Hoplias malabaricus]|uniref:SERTA domain-containing protein 2 n=1 Tax=Hoplias malabaricus TaxID=27720 RepID=UPI003462F8AB
MSCPLGLKRKLQVEDEDDEVEKQPKVAALSDAQYSLQRETVLHLSLQKLCTQVQTALVRRVLITNTLRLIQQGPLVSAQTQRGIGADAEGSLTPAWALEQDGELLFSLHSSVPAPSSSSAEGPSAKDGFSTALAEIEDLCPSLLTSDNSTCSSVTTASFTPQTNPQGSPTQTHILGVPASEALDKETALSSGVFDSSGSISLPELSLDDFLFSDIDNFLCELNPCGPNPGLAQGSSSSSKVVSMVTDDLLRSLTNQPFKTDLNELDHIMEVLVGS